MKKQNTHLSISKNLVGSVVEINNNSAKVTLEITEEMTADQFGLAHGGFIFGLADYAAMLAINTPNVVLGKVESIFLKPVKVREQLTAIANIKDSKGIKYNVTVFVYNKQKIKVFEGNFTCFDLKNHVLE